MTQESAFELVQPVPTIVLTLGRQAAEIAVEVKGLYLRSDARRKPITHFLTLVKGGNGQPAGPEVSAGSGEYSWKLLDVEQALVGCDQNQVNFDLGAQGLVKAFAALQNILQTILHDLLTHENYLVAGSQNNIMPPLNLVVMADLWDPEATGVLLPLALILQDLVKNIPEVMGQFIFNIAHFPNEQKSGVEKARLLVFLQALDTLIDPSQSHQAAPLALSLGIDHPEPLAFRFFLFDHRKEFGWEVKDQVELKTILGNFLLAVLTNEIARRMNDAILSEYSLSQRPFYCGAGSAILAFDPTPVVESCAGRQGDAFIQTQFWETVSIDRRLVTEKAAEIETRLGTLRSWLEKIIVDTPLSIAAQEDADISLVNFQAGDLKFKDYPLDKIAKADWPATIDEVAKDLNAKIPDLQTAVNQRTIELKQGLNKLHAPFIDELLQNARLYPGGLHMGKLILQKWNKRLDARLKAVEKLSASLESPADPQKQLADDLELLKSALLEFPKIDRWVLLLPTATRQQVLSLLMVVRLRKSFQKIMEAREKCRRDIIRMVEAPFRKLTLDQITSCCSELNGSVLQALADLDQLEQILKNVQARLVQKANAFPYLKDHQPGHPVFRFYPAGAKVLETAYTRWKSNEDAMRQALLIDQKLLENWQKKTEQEIFEGFMEFGLKNFAPIWDWTLEDVMEIELEKAGEISEKIIMLDKASLPLLAPNFNVIGDRGNPPLDRFLLLRDPSARMLEPVFGGAFKDWRSISTRDPYVMGASQIRRQVPLAALKELLADCEKAFLTLSEDEKQKLQFIQALDLTETSSTTILTPGGQTTLVHKVFHWGFKARKYSTDSEIAQKIELDISQERYTKAHQEPRLLQEQWDHYAAAEMPEVRALATAFLNLHASQDWATLVQASNVLSFVQSCIPYSRDEKTTGHADWPRYPIETLMDGTGDCEDVAILSASIMARMGFQVALLFYPSHVVVGILGDESLEGDYIHDPVTGKRYYYAEATARGWHIGKIPKEYRETAPVKILPIILVLEAK